MKDMQLNGDAVCEYLLVINPPEELRKEIFDFHQEFYAVHPHIEQTHISCNIALVNFLAFENNDVEIGERLCSIAEGMSPFAIEIRDFKCLENSRIYLDVLPNESIKNIQAHLKLVSAELMAGDKDHLPFYVEPHINIARQFRKSHFKKAWRSYANRRFSASFTAETMTLKKRYRLDQPYEVIWDIEFGKPLVDIKELACR